MSGQDFCGQSGQGLAGLWHGIASTPVDIEDVIPGLAAAWAAVIGAMIPAPSMASAPRIRGQRWKRRRFTVVNVPYRDESDNNALCHTICRLIRRFKGR